MSYIPAKAMHHAHAEPGQFDAEEGKIMPIAPAPAKNEAFARNDTLAWVLGAASAGVAVAAIAALFTLRSSSPRKPARRGPSSGRAANKPRRTAKKAA